MHLKIIRGTLDCCNNNIKTFEHFPNFIKHSFFCDNNPIFDVWSLFYDYSKIELLNDFDILETKIRIFPSIFIDRLNDFLEMIGKKPIKRISGYFYKEI